MTRGQRLFVFLNGLFIAFLLLAEFMGSKLFQLDVSGTGIFPAIGINTFEMTLGVIPFPLTFIITDLLNEYYGRKGVRFTTLLGMTCVVLVYLLVFVGLRIPAWKDSPVDDKAFQSVFAGSGAIIVGSVVAYLVGQLIDIQVFHFLRKKTKNKHIWLRATGSTVVSQLIDSFIVIFIAFGTGLGPVTFPAGQCFKIASTNYVYKLLIAILITPLIYLGHHWMERYMGQEARDLSAKAHHDESFNITVYPG